VGLVLGALWLATLAEIRAKKRPAPDAAEATAPESPAGATSSAAGPRRPTLEQDGEALSERLDLGALASAKRLWAAGRREEVLRAIEDDRTTPGLRLELVLLAASEPEDDLRRIARRLLQEGQATKELTALLHTIAGEGSPGGGQDE
jgi:hypothetical protein